LLLGIRLYSRGFFHVGTDQASRLERHGRALTDEYHVPVFASSDRSADGDSHRISMPLCLRLDCATRFGAFVLFFFNIVAVVSYASHAHVAVKDALPVGCADFWCRFVFGPGQISLDRWLEDTALLTENAKRAKDAAFRLTRPSQAGAVYRWHATHCPGRAATAASDPLERKAGCSSARRPQSARASLQL
jgi:putative oxidoreductase